MCRRKTGAALAAAALTTALLGGGVTQAAETFWKAYPSTQPIRLNGQQVEMTAYNINGSNYVKLRDVGELVGFNVYWDGTNVQVDSTAPYTGQAPASALPQLTPQPTPQPVPSAAPVTQDVEAMRQEIVDRANAVRLQHGLSSLPTDPLLMRAAQVRAEEMAATGVYSHTRPDGSPWSTAVDTKWVGENIHCIATSNLEWKGKKLAKLCMEGWVASRGHLENILRENLTATGVGIARQIDEYGEEWWYCVQWFLYENGTVTWVDTPKIP